MHPPRHLAHLRPRTAPRGPCNSIADETSSDREALAMLDSGSEFSLFDSSGEGSRGDTGPTSDQGVHRRRAPPQRQGVRRRSRRAQRRSRRVRHRSRRAQRQPKGPREAVGQSLHRRRQSPRRALPRRHHCSALYSILLSSTTTLPSRTDHNLLSTPTLSPLFLLSMLRCFSCCACLYIAN